MAMHPQRHPAGGMTPEGDPLFTRVLVLMSSIILKVMFLLMTLSGILVVSTHWGDPPAGLEAFPRLTEITLLPLPFMFLSGCLGFCWTEVKQGLPLAMAGLGVLVGLVLVGIALPPLLSPYWVGEPPAIPWRSWLVQSVAFPVIAFWLVQEPDGEEGVDDRG